MKPAPAPREKLEHCRKKLLSGHAPTLNDLKAIWRLSRHPDAQIREAALILLSSPPVEDDSLYLKACIDACLKFGPVRGREIPLPAFEQLFDLWEQADASGIELVNAPEFQALLNRLPLRPLLHLMGRPYSLQVFFPHVAQRLGLLLSGHLPPRDMRRWRRLTTSLSRRRTPDDWDRLTFGDLHPLAAGSLPGRLKSRRASHPPGRWLFRCRPLLLQAAKSIPPVELSTFRRVRWAGLGNLSLSWLDRLLDQQARELSSIGGLAHEVSRRTRRVVFSWHNAGLAAAGGWSFEDLEAAFPSPKLWGEFVQAAKAREMELQSAAGHLSIPASRLLRMREARLAIPAISRALEEACCLKRLDPAWERACTNAQAAAAPFMEAAAIRDEAHHQKHGWPGPRSPGPRQPLRDILAWWEGQRKSWGGGFMRLAALAAEAERLLSRGDLESFVLPWIDKFFISSLRLTDSAYLPALVRWLEDRGVAPLILFWEDTIHGTQPSFRLALDTMRAQGLPFRGIGVFDEGDSDRRRALQCICSAHPEVRLFALRPWDDTHHPGSFHRMLKERDFSYLAHYDSSWKDNLGFLYVGTQVFPLLSDAGYREDLPAWVAVGHDHHPFGQVFRQVLRRKALGRKCRQSGDPVSAQYAHWANLG